MQLMANGLAGHEYEFYHIVRDSPWLGGRSEYSPLHEGLPYWFNGLVPLAYGLDDPRLKKQTNSAVDYVLDHQHADGWLGSEQGDARDIWGRFPLFLGLMQLVEADASQATRILSAMYKFVTLLHSMLIGHNGFEQFWGRVRYPDMLICLQWMYERHPEINSDILLETMHLLRQQGLNWEDYYDPSAFIFKDLDTVHPPITDDSPVFPYVHGVNAGQGVS